MSTLKIRLRQDRYKDYGYLVANIFDVTAATTSRVHKNYKSIPIAIGTRDFSLYEVPPGTYIVEAILPSSEIVAKEVTVNNEEDVLEVDLVGKPEHDDTNPLKCTGRSWSGGKVQNIQLRVSSDLIKEAIPNVWIVSSGPTKTSYPRNLGDIEKNRLDYSVNYSSLVSWSSLYRLSELNVDEALVTLSQRLSYVKNKSRFSDLEKIDLASEHSDSINEYHCTADCRAHIINTAVNTTQHKIVQKNVTYLNDFLKNDKNLTRHLLVIAGLRIQPEIIMLPLPWEMIENPHNATIDVFISSSKDIIRGSKREYRINNILLSVNDARMVGILDYLGQGNFPDASVLVKQATGLLFDKLKNPLAAVAGAYVLLTTEKDLMQKNWHHWIENLMNWFPRIPDGSIIFGWMKLKHSRSNEDEATARTALLNAYWQGIPYFSMGVRWLLDGLTILNRLAKDDDREDSEIEEALTVVRQIARRVDITRPFTSIRIGVGHARSIN